MSTGTLATSEADAAATGPPIAVSRFATVADLLDALGGIGPERVRMTPWPGTATEADLLALGEDQGRCVELVDGVLVEKPMGFWESRLAIVLSFFLESYLSTNRKGIVAGPDGMIMLSQQRFRAPDLAFYLWSRFPDGKIPETRIPSIAPDLAVEVLSASNTKAEMDRKRAEYFAAGVQVVWMVDPPTMSVAVHEANGASRQIGTDESLTCELLIPGFTLPLRQLFDRAAGG